MIKARLLQWLISNLNQRLTPRFLMDVQPDEFNDPSTLALPVSRLDLPKKTKNFCLSIVYIEKFLLCTNTVVDSLLTGINWLLQEDRLPECHLHKNGIMYYTFGKWTQLYEKYYKTKTEPCGTPHLRGAAADIVWYLKIYNIHNILLVSNTNSNRKKVYFIYVWWVLCIEPIIHQRIYDVFHISLSVFKIRINVVVLANSEKCVSLSVKVAHNVVLEVNNGNQAEQYQEGFKKVKEILEDLKGNIKNHS